MTDTILICANRAVSTLSGDEIPALPDGTVPIGFMSYRFGSC